MNPITLYSIIGLALALLLSAGGHVVQYMSAAKAAAECKAAAAQVLTDIATGTAAAEKEYAGRVATIALAASADEAERMRVLDEATKRISTAATRYASASKNKPLPPDCRADAERVQAVNTARGHTE